MAGPRWREIAEDLQERINGGEFAEADPEQQRAAGQLPSESKIQERYGDVSRNTVRQAIDFLTARRVVEKRPGQGTFLVEELRPIVSNLTVDGRAETVRYRDDAKRAGRMAATSAPRLEIKPAGEWLSDTLGIDLGEPVIVRHQRRYIDDRPFSLQTSYYPMTFVQAGASALLMVDDIAGGVVAYLRAALGVEEAGTIDQISARPPDPDETAIFGIPTAVPILVHRRTTYDCTGKPIRVTITTYPADRNTFALRAGDGPPPPH